MKEVLKFLVILMVLPSGFVFAQENQNPDSPFKVEVSTVSTAAAKGQFTVSIKITNISNEKQKITTLGCSNNWITDNPSVFLAEVCDSTILETQILNPKEEYTEKHNLAIKALNNVTPEQITFRLGFQNIEEDVRDTKIDPNNALKAPKYMQRTWSNPVVINI